MSPEQARGLTVDKRTDIWAFGVVLYEMLTARQAFRGQTALDTIAAVIDREPDWSALPPALPDQIRRLLHHCLARDPKRRLRDIGDARTEIDDAVATPHMASTAAARPGPQGGRAWPLWLALVLATTAAVVLGTRAFRSNPAE